MPTSEIARAQERVYSPEVKSNFTKIFITPDGMYIDTPAIEIKNGESIIHCTLNVSGNIDVYTLNPNGEKVKFDYVGSDIEAIIQTEFSDKFEYKLAENRYVLEVGRSDIITSLKKDYKNSNTGLNLEETNMVAQRLSPITGGSNPELDPDKNRLHRVREATKNVVESWKGYEAALDEDSVDALKVEIGEYLKKVLRAFPNTIYTTANELLNENSEKFAQNAGSDNWKPRIAKVDPKLIEEILQKPNIYESIMPSIDPAEKFNFVNGVNSGIEDTDSVVPNTNEHNSKPTFSVETIREKTDSSHIKQKSFGESRELLQQYLDKILEIVDSRVKLQSEISGLENNLVNTKLTDTTTQRNNKKIELTRLKDELKTSSAVYAKLFLKLSDYPEYTTTIRKKVREIQASNDELFTQKNALPTKEKVKLHFDLGSAREIASNLRRKTSMKIGVGLAALTAAAGLVLNRGGETQIATNYIPEKQIPTNNEQLLNKNTKQELDSSEKNIINGFELTESPEGVKTVVLNYSEKDLRAVAKQTSKSGKPNVNTIYKLIKEKVDGDFYESIMRQIEENRVENIPLSSIVKIKKPEKGFFEIVIQLPKVTSDRVPTIPSKLDNRKDKIKNKTII